MSDKKDKLKVHHKAAHAVETVQDEPEKTVIRSLALGGVTGGGSTCAATGRPGAAGPCATG